jgi:exonuclease III
MRILQYNVSWESLQAVSATIDMRHCKVCTSTSTTGAGADTSCRNQCALNIGRVIAESGADVICLQEIRRSNAAQWASLTSAIELVDPAFFTKYDVYASEPGPVAGIATLVRKDQFTLVQELKGDLLTPATDIRPGFSLTPLFSLFSTLEKPLAERTGRPYLITVFRENLIVVNLHFPQAYEMRKHASGLMNDVNALLRTLPQFTLPRYNIIMCGDFNYEVQPFAFLALRGSGKRFHESQLPREERTYTCCDPGMDGAHPYTWNSDLVFTTIGPPRMSSLTPEQRVQFTDVVSTPRASLTATEQQFVSPTQDVVKVEKRFMSDHMPVIVDVVSLAEAEEDARAQHDATCTYLDTTTRTFETFNKDTVPRSLFSRFNTAKFQESCVQLTRGTYNHGDERRADGCARHAVVRRAPIPLSKSLTGIKNEEAVGCFRGYDNEYLGVLSIPCENSGSCCGVNRCVAVSGDTEDKRCLCNADPLQRFQSFLLPSAVVRAFPFITDFVAPNVLTTTFTQLHFCKPHGRAFVTVLMSEAWLVYQKSVFAFTNMLAPLLAKALLVSQPELLAAFNEAYGLDQAFLRLEQTEVLDADITDSPQMVEARRIKTWVQSNMPTLSGALKMKLSTEALGVGAWLANRFFRK